MKSMEESRFSHKEEQNRKRYQEEGLLEQEWRRMKAYYPRRAAAVQAAVEDACDRLDYEGSFLFDEHPDPWMVRRTCQDICRQLNGRKNIQAMAVFREDLPKDSLSDLTQALFCQEMHRRRCRRKRLKRI